jgi:integrase
MDCTKHSPAYLVRNLHSWCFRLIVPLPLRWVVGKRELRYSLKTGAIGIAKRKARFLAGRVQFIFQLLQRGWQGMGELTQDQIQLLIGNYIKKSIADMDQVFLDQRGEEERPYQDIEGFNSYVSGLSSIREDLIANLNLGNFSMLEGAIDTFLKANGIDKVDKGSPEYHRLCVEIHKAESKLLPIQQQHMQCDFSYKEQLPAIFPEVFAAKEERPAGRREEDEPKKRKRIELSQALNEYWKWKEPQLKPGSVPEYKRAFDHFLKFADGGKDITEINVDVMRKYQHKLRTEKSRFGTIRKTVTIKNKFITPVQGFFADAVKREYITRNPVDNLIWEKERKDKRPDNERTHFSIPELRMIFCESAEYKQDSMEYPYQFWMPLIGLYTGMRIREVAQLYVSDIIQIDGFWCLDINQNEDKTVKNSTPRKVPLHPFLVNDLNFVGFVQSLPDRDDRIFPELLTWANPSQHAGWWFSKFKARCGVVAGKGSKAFHAFRYTVTHQLYREEVDREKAEMFVGHTVTGQNPHYAGKFDPDDLYNRVVLKLNYGLDLSHLTKSKWVVR